MHTATKLASLRRAPCFAGLSEKDFVKLLSALPSRQLKQGDTLFERGELGDGMVILIDGKLNVGLRLDSGEEQVLRQLVPGDVVGEMACIDPSPRSATVSAPWDATALQLSRGHLEELRHRSPHIATAVVGGIVSQVTQRIRETNRRIGMELARLRSPQLSAGARALKAELNGKSRGWKPYRGNIELSGLSILGDLTHKDLEILKTVASAKVYDAGALLCQEGQAGTSCFILLSGKVEVIKASAGGPRILTRLKPGTLVGQMALVDKGARSATVRASEEAIVLELARDVFERLLAAASPLAMRFQDHIAVACVQQLRLANDRLSRLLNFGQDSLTLSGKFTLPQQMQFSPSGSAQPAAKRTPVPQAKKDLVRAMPSSLNAHKIMRKFDADKHTDLRAMARMLSYIEDALGGMDLSLEDLQQFAAVDKSNG